MTEEELLAEGRALARESVHLVPVADGRELAAYWRGSPVVPAPMPGCEHWISVRCELIPGLLRPGWVSVFTHGSLEGIAAFDPHAEAPSTPSGSVPLFAERRSCLPPLEAIELVGSLRAREWLAPCGPHVPEDVANAAVKVMRSYERAYQATWPLYTRSAHAILGGWHMAWPEDDDYDPERRLLVWTIAESEPWVEVWEEEGELRVVQRIT